MVLVGVLALALPGVALAKEYSADSVRIAAQVQSNGDLNITEYRTMLQAWHRVGTLTYAWRPAALP